MVTVMVLEVQGNGDDWPVKKVRMAGSTTLSTSTGLTSPMGTGAMLVQCDEAEIMTLLAACAIMGFSRLNCRTMSSPILIFMPLLTVMTTLSPMSTSAMPVSFSMGDSKMPASAIAFPGVATILLLPACIWSVWAVRDTYHGCTKSPLTTRSRSSRSSLLAALAVMLISEFIEGYPTTMLCSTVLSSRRLVTVPISSILATRISLGTGVNCVHPELPPRASWSQ
mmetsp:Transcript_6057/g.14592  ORF Transcript_6057/g.14592 Transcript_6057/m.14592 type:complete len:224 (+) Transcript_6057:6871-7542(+)